MNAQLRLLPALLTAHLQLTMAALLAGALVSIPLGIFVRRSPRKFTSGLRPSPPPDGGAPSSGGSPASVFGRKLFIDAQAWIKVPSTEKCSFDASPRHWANSTTRPKKVRTTSSLSSRSRLALKVEWSHTGSSSSRPTNQRYSRWYSSGSTHCLSDRTEYSTWITLARNSRSGAIEVRPPWAYHFARSWSIVRSRPSTTTRSFRMGYFFGIRSSKVR